MALSPKGILFVGTRQEGKVYAVLDRDKDHTADEVLVVAENMHMPNGVAVRGGSLYVAEISRVLRFDNIEADPPARFIESAAKSNETAVFVNRYSPFAADAALIMIAAPGGPI